METMHRNQLTGYRNPTQEEVERMSTFIEKQDKHAIRLFSGWFYVCIFFYVIIFINIVNLDTGSKILDVLLKLVIILAGLAPIYYFRSIVQKYKNIVKEVKQGNLKVLDCYAYICELDLNATNTAVVKIYHDGEYCEDYFSVNTDTMNKWKENNQYPMTLLKCSYDHDEKHTRYELFTESRLNRE